MLPDFIQIIYVKQPKMFKNMVRDLVCQGEFVIIRSTIRFRFMYRTVRYLFNMYFPCPIRYFRIGDVAR